MGGERHTLGDVAPAIAKPSARRVVGLLVPSASRWFVWAALLAASCSRTAPAVKVDPAKHVDTEARRDLPMPNRDPAVEIVLLVQHPTVGPGKLPTLTAEIHNRGSEDFWASAEPGPGPGLRLGTLAYLVEGGAGHQRIAMHPARMLVPAGQARRVVLYHPHDHPDTFLRWAAGPHELVLDYTTPSQVSTWTRTARWTLVDDGTARDRSGRLEHVLVSISARDLGAEVLVTVRARNREVRPMSLPRILELSWIAGGNELVASEAHVLGEPSLLPPLTELEIARLTVDRPPVTGRLMIAAEWRRPGEAQPASRATAIVY